MDERLDRQRFLRRAGLGSIALASLPALTDNAFAAAQTFGQPVFFHYYSLSKAAVVNGVAHAVAMSGSGRVTHNDVLASGSYTHFDLAAAVPKPAITSGTWKAKRFLSLHLTGTWGTLAGGVLDMEIELQQVSPSPAVIPATLEIVANIGSADLFVAGKDVGFTLTIPGADYGPFESFGPFPLAEGLAVFSLGHES
jgi:hypothetical protein